MKQLNIKEELTAEAFEKFVLVKLAPVLVGIKPAMLLGMCNCRQSKDRSKNLFGNWEKHKHLIAEKFNISFMELKRSEKGVQVLFYKQKLLKSIFADASTKLYMNKFGYRTCNSNAEFLAKLKKRFNSMSFPHEVGIFLGYPIKDVKGFVEKKGTCFVMSDRWKIYGCPDSSLRLIEQYERVEKIFISLLLENRNPLKHKKAIRRFVLNPDHNLDI